MRFRAVALQRPPRPAGRDARPHPMRLTRQMAVLGLVATLTLTVPAAGAAEFSGVTFADSVRVGGTDLLLNGLGLRSLFILKAYVAGLYVPQRSSDAADLLAQTGPRRLALKMLVEMSPERMIKLFRDGFATNLSEPQQASLEPQIEQLYDALRAMGPARKGDTVDIDLVDGQTSVALNGQPRGKPVSGDALFAAMLRVFIGARPADRELKRGLLGG